MNRITRGIVVAALASLSATLMAANIVGTWKGKVTVDLSKAPKAQNDQQRAMMDKILADVRKMDIRLTIRANKTFAAVAKRSPSRPGPQNTEGTWKQEGSTLWLTSLKVDDKPAKDKKPQRFQILENGKKLSLNQEGMPTWIKIIFTR
jgi:hypothetical protein